MDISELPRSQADLTDLTWRLAKYCEDNDITKFEPDEIIELISDGEDIEWIVDQLGSDSQAIVQDELKGILAEIANLVASPEEGDDVNMAKADETALSPDIRAVVGEISDAVSEKGFELPDLSQIDDMSLLSGMDLPPGLDIKQVQKMMQTPQGIAMLDFGLFCQEKGISDLESTLSDQQKMNELREEWMNTPRPMLEDKKPIEKFGADPLLSLQKPETYRRDQPRVGRNDPCPCGSGKKYKKCCGRGE